MFCCFPCCNNNDDDLDEAEVKYDEDEAKITQKPNSNAAFEKTEDTIEDTTDKADFKEENGEEMKKIDCAQTEILTKTVEPMASSLAVEICIDAEEEACKKIVKEPSFQSEDEAPKKEEFEPCGYFEEEE